MSQTQTRERSTIEDFTFAESSSANVPAVAPGPTIEPHTLAVLNRSEIEAQTEHADHKPREYQKFIRTVRQLVTISEEAAAECIYALPPRRSRRDDDDDEKGKPIEGPSIRFAEIMAYAWQNCRIGARVIEEGMAHISAQGIFNDLEMNNVTTFEVRRRITDRKGRRYSPDMINLTANAACSIARRNAILQAIPRPLWWDLYREARAIAAGAADLSKLRERRDAAFAYAQQKLNVDEKRVLTVLGLESRDQVGVDELALLRGTFTAIRDGETSVGEAFGSTKETPPSDKPSSLDQFAAGNSSPSHPEERPAAGGTDQPTTSESAPAGATTPPDAPAANLRADLVARLMKLAAEDAGEDARLESLQILKDSIDADERFSADFVRAALETTAKVIRGDLKPAAARKYLESLK